MTVLHYFDDNGHACYETPNNLILKLAEIVVPKKVDNFHQFQLELRHKLYNAGAGIIQGWQIHSTMAGLGGCLNLQQWREKNDEDPLEQILKEMMFHFTDQNYLYREFLSVIESVYCQIIFAFYE